MARYELWLADDEGNRLENLNWFRTLEYVITTGQPGYMTLELPYEAQYLINDTTKPDRQIHIWRAPEGGSLELQQIYMIQRWTFRTDDSGNETVTIAGVGPNHLLNRRIVAYYAGSPGALFSGVAADNIMKRLVSGALGAASNTNYDGSGIVGRNITALGFSIEAEASAGPVVSRACAWQQLQSTLRSIQEQSKTEGTEVFYDILALTTSPATFQFVTKTGQPGDDRTLAGTSPLRFGLEFGNVRNPSVTVDYNNLQNHVYSGGAGQESERVIEEVQDPTSIAESQFGRREGFTAEVSSDNSLVVQAAAKARLSDYRQRTSFSGEIQDTDQAPYGGDGWKVGDKVTVAYHGFVFNSIIRSGRIFVGGDGDETVTGYIESV